MNRAPKLSITVGPECQCFSAPIVPACPPRPPWWSVCSALVGAERPDGAAAVPLTRTQRRRREGCLVRRVGVVLRLEAEAGPLRVDAPALAGDRAVEEVARVELD